MANTCSVDHKVYLNSNNQNTRGMEELDAFFSLLSRCGQPDSEKNLLRGMLLELYGEDVVKKLNCRSMIVSFNRDDAVINISEATAWCPCISAWDVVLARFPSLSHAWAAREPGCELYEKFDNDGMFSDRTYAISSNADKKLEFGVEYATLEEWRKALEPICGEKLDGSSIEDVITRAQAILTAKGFRFSVHSYFDGR